MNRTLRIMSLGAVLLSAGIAAAGPAILPDAPQASRQLIVAQESGGGQQTGTSTNPQTPASAPSLLASPVNVPIGQLGLKGKFDFYLKVEFAPANFVIPAGVALFHMADPPDQYPHRWRDGAGAFGRNYGSGLASAFSGNTARFITGAVLHEEPRYFPSENHAFGARVFHALKFTLIDKADSGRDRIAISNFAGAAAGGFIGNAYLPAGFRDLTHAGQRSLFILAVVGGENEAAEFRPEIRATLKKMHVPFIK
ncbi:MAG TPA: hypothetical protein VGD59_05945 [Acidisarcina sp.]